MVRIVLSFVEYKLVRYLLAGGTGAAVHIGVVFVLTHLFDVWYRIATLTGFLLSFFISFVLQKFWTFRDASVDRVRRQMTVFFSVAVLNFFMNLGLMIVFVEYVGLWPTFAQACASALIAIESFLIYSVIFKRTTVANVVPEGGPLEVVMQVGTIATDAQTHDRH